MADDLIPSRSWTAYLKKIDSPVEERNLSVRRETFTGPRFRASDCKDNSETCEADSEVRADLFRRDNFVKKVESSGSVSSLPAIHAASNGPTGYRVVEEATHNCDCDAQKNTEQFENKIQKFSMGLQDVGHSVGTKNSPDTLCGPSFQVISNSPSAAMVMEYIDLKAGLGRAQSAKERLGPTEYLRDHCKCWKTTLARTRSASTVAHMILKPDSAVGFLKRITAKSEILEKTRSLIDPVSDTRQVSKHYGENFVGIPIMGSDLGAELGQDTGSISDDDLTSPIEEVALIVPNTDDPSIPVWTFRTAVLGVFACVLITFLNTYFSYRNEPIVITVTTVLIATAPLGKFMAAVLPNKFVRLPGTQWGFSLNPGPWNMKEHALITIFASAGAVRPGGIFVVNMVKVYFNGRIEFLPGFVVTLTIELLGYSWAVILQRFLVDPARMWWPGSLVNVSLVRGLNLDISRNGFISPLQFFLVFFIVASAYYVVPGFFIPSISTVSVICLIFKHNVRAQQLGSGYSGLGLGAFSFNWATISGFLGSPLVVPWAAVVNMSIGFMIQAYAVVPITYWKNWYRSKNFPIFSSTIFTSSGKIYDVSQIMPSQSRHRNLHIDGGEGLTYFSAFYTMSMGFTFALFGAVCSQVIFFHGKDLVQIFKAIVAGRESNDVDAHIKLMRKYPRVPLRWGVMLFLGTHLAAIINVVIYKDQLEIRWWGIMLTTLISIVMVVPIAVLTATTNQVPNLGIIPQYLMGIISSGEPITNVMFRSYSTVVCGRTSNYLMNFKLGHYMKIPPRATFYGQLISTFISAFVATIVALWLIDSIDNICDTSKLPRDTPWTCPQDRVFYDQAVSFGLVGPRRLFVQSGAPYRTLNFYFLPGFFFPILVWMMRLALPGRGWLRLINAPLIVRGACLMPPSPVVSNTMWIFVALFFSIYVFEYKKKWWQKYNYVLSAAMDAGTVVMALLLYYALDSGKEKLSWWGQKSKGDHCPLASCPTAHGVYKHGCPVHS